MVLVDDDDEGPAPDSGEFLLFFDASRRDLFQPSRRSTIAPPEHCGVSYVVIATAAAATAT
jgi:hypothetical protein